MDAKTKQYGALAVVFLASVGLFVLFESFPISKLVSDLAGIPAIGSLVGALFLLARDRMAYDRSVQQDESKNRFTIGATSHMASVAFDKHVAFCEEYVGEVQKALIDVFLRGPRPQFLEPANNLRQIRLRWALWLTPELEAKLVTFEAAVRSIGAKALTLDHFKQEDDEGGRAEFESQMWREFKEFGVYEQLGDKKMSNERALETVITRLRQVLGVDELTRLRSELVTRALENLKDANKLSKQTTHFRR